MKLNKLEKSINWIIKSYLDNNFGVPSSFENIGRYKDCMLKYNKLIKNKYYIKSFNSDFDRILINDINGLVKLETYLNNPLIKEILHKIDNKNITKKKTKDKEKEKKDLGEKDVEIILDNNDVIIYHPTTENGSDGRYGSYPQQVIHNTQNIYKIELIEQPKLLYRMPKLFIDVIDAFHTQNTDLMQECCKTYLEI